MIDEKYKTANQRRVRTVWQCVYLGRLIMRKHIRKLKLVLGLL